MALGIVNSMKLSIQVLHIYSEERFAYTNAKL